MCVCGNKFVKEYKEDVGGCVFSFIILLFKVELKISYIGTTMFSFNKK